MKFIYTASCLYRSSAQLAAFLVQRSKDELIQTPLCNAVVHLGIGRLERIAKSENSTKVGTTKKFIHTSQRFDFTKKATSFTPTSLTPI